jgi:hypothetical protein
MRRHVSFLVAGRDALRTYWGSAALIVTAGAVALAGVIPVVRLANALGTSGSRLRFSSVRPSSLGFHWGANASTPADAQAQTIALLFQLMLVAAFATLVLAAISILSISAARASARRPEMAVRRAVGASRRNLLAAALAEGGVIGTATLVIGLTAGSLGLVAALAGWPGRFSPGTPGPAVFAASAVAATIVLGALFQLLSAPSRRIAEPEPQPVALYIPAIQLAMGLTVLVASTMLVRHATGLLKTTSATPAPGIVLAIGDADASPAVRSARIQSLLERLRQDPGVESVSVMSPGALVGLGMNDAVTTDCGFCPDGGVVIKWHLVFTTHQFVTADTFGALGIDQVEGRPLTDADHWNAPPVAVISRTLARRHFQNGEALGRQILLKLDQPKWYTVVGVVEDRVPEGFGGQVQPRSAIYLSALQLPPQTADLLVRPRSGYSIHRTQQLLAQAGVTQAAPQSEEQLVAREAGPVAWFGRGFALLGWAMLLITSASTFVLMRLWVRSLHPELGLRRAVGARWRHLFRYVLLRASLTACAGVAIALWFGPALWDTLPEMVPGLQGWSLALVGPLALILLGIALAGAVVPAIAASRETPNGLIGSTGE